MDTGCYATDCLFVVDRAAMAESLLDALGVVEAFDVVEEGGA